MEHIPEDIWTGTTLTVSPYFDNVINASAFGAEVVWPENETLHAIPTIKTVDQMERLEIPDPNAGLWGRVQDWWSQFADFAQQTRITFDGREGRVETAGLSIDGCGPHMIAIDLVGTDFYWWMIEYPQQCHRLLRKITDGMIQAENRCRTIDPRPRGAYGIAEDSVQIMSPEMFREFAVPYDNILYDAFGDGLVDGRGMHMCGKSAHLHEALVQDARITSFNVFGYQVDPEVAAQNLPGVLLWGNINPMLLLDGSKAEVKAEAAKCLEVLAPCGGFMLGDGANVCPGTPIENLAALTEAAQDYGLPTVDPSWAEGAGA
jgi:uroporphyrinogen-III decarboxylase